MVILGSFALMGAPLLSESEAQRASEPLTKCLLETHAENHGATRSWRDSVDSEQTQNSESFIMLSLRHTLLTHTLLIYTLLLPPSFVLELNP